MNIRAQIYNTRKNTRFTVLLLITDFQFCQKLSRKIDRLNTAELLAFTIVKMLEA